MFYVLKCVLKFSSGQAGPLPTKLWTSATKNALSSTTRIVLGSYWLQQKYSSYLAMKQKLLLSWGQKLSTKNRDMMFAFSNQLINNDCPIDSNHLQKRMRVLILRKKLDVDFQFFSPFIELCTFFNWSRRYICFIIFL